MSPCFNESTLSIRSDGQTPLILLDLEMRQEIHHREGSLTHSEKSRLGERESQLTLRKLRVGYRHLAPRKINNQ
ncbi:hypothetical protein HYC85_001565 [Camellia sinensis]|uniref:Uncharacterized protein n=1 Tax=Camellia sinensis TaxID=4442 RepID=A0A7J7I770_CAMSI|nr:hypothetical protein HYC85_001565 [Camellia sinensis]